MTMKLRSNILRAVSSALTVAVMAGLILTACDETPSPSSNTSSSTTSSSTTSSSTTSSSTTSNTSSSTPSKPTSGSNTPDTRPVKWTYKVYDNGTIGVTGYDEDEGAAPVDVTIPKTIDGRVVTGISNSAFKDCKTLKRVVIPGTVERVNEMAFENCPKLETVELQEGLKYVDWRAFVDCVSLKNVYLPNSLQRLGTKFDNYYSGVFSGCISLKSIVIRGNYESIGNNTFDGCTSLEWVALPKTIKLIADSAFRGCINLKDVYYEGDAEEWKNVRIGVENGCFKAATVHTDYTVK